MRRSLSTWGTGVLTQLAGDLRAEFPEMRGFSATNLKYMRQLAQAWPDSESIGPQRVDQLPWGHLRALLGVKDASARKWYLDQALDNGWSRNVLEHHLRTKAHERVWSAPSNFAKTLDELDSDLAQQLTKDPYVLDFLALDGDSNERDLEDALVTRIIHTLRELGDGFAFVGRQKHFEVDGDDFFVDLLFFHIEQLRYVVVELKTGKFEPAFAGQLGFYVALVDERLRREQHAGTVGILLVASKNDSVVRYALSGAGSAIAVASFDLLPPELQAALPSEESLARALSESTSRRVSAALDTAALDTEEEHVGSLGGWRRRGRGLASEDELL
jgi:predicted nuclease of restriction endonuclease-like (RecB) superfamily